MSSALDSPNGIPALPGFQGTPLWWLLTLEQRLLRRQPAMLDFAAYYDGEHPLPFLTKTHEAKMRDEFRRLLEESRSNFMRLVVDTTEERLAVEGFRLSGSSDALSDKESWDIWQANQMDAKAQEGFVESLIKCVSYLSVWSDDDNDGYPDIAIEDPLQTIVAYAPGSHYRKRLAAAKIWLDEYTGERRANLYMPDAIYKFAGQGPAFSTDPSPAQQSEVSWAEIEEERVSNPLGVVPIIPLRNRPRLLTEGESELADVFRVQNQINGFLFLQALAGYFGAHKQRWATGVTLFEDPKGRPIEPFNTAVDKLWLSENSATQFGEFSATDLSGYINAIEQKVLHIAVTTRTPRHYLIQQGQSPSGDALKSAESGLVKKVERKQRMFGESLEEAIRLARRFAGAQDAPPDSEIVWADAEQRSYGAITDAVVKQYVAGLIPSTVALERMGYTQVQIRQIQNAPPEQFADLSADLSPAIIGAVDKRALTGSTHPDNQIA